jgi:hypothetical protein
MKTEIKFFRIQAKHSGKFQDVLEQSQDNGANVGQWDDNPGDQQRWRLIPEDVVMPELPALGQLPRVRPRLEGTFRPSPQGKTYIVNRQFVPFFAVEDADHDGSWKVKNSPYYMLETQQRYISKDEWFLTNDTSEVLNLEFENTSGWSETESSEFTHTTSMTVSASAGYGPVEASVEVTQEFSTTEGTESGRFGERTKTVSIPVGANKTVAGWAIESVFVLRRMDGSTVKSWSVHGGYFFDEFPDHVVASIPNRLVPFLEVLETALDETSRGECDPDRAKAIAQLARAATAIVEARKPD